MYVVINVLVIYITGTERSPDSCSQIFILKLIYHIYSYYCNVVCFSDVGLQPGNEILITNLKIIT